jgi:hypothetical protein
MDFDSVLRHPRYLVVGEASSFNQVRFPQRLQDAAIQVALVETGR